MERRNKPVESFYYSEDEWNRLGCGPLPAERDRSQQQQRQDVHARGNPLTDNNHVKGYN